VAHIQLDGLAHHRAIVAVDIEQSTRRPDPVKAELREKTYEFLEAALQFAGIGNRHRDRFIDRGDGLLALIHPVRQAPKAVLLDHAVPALSQLLNKYNVGVPQPRRLRLRIVVHAGEVRYDSHGCFGEALDIAFRLLDDIRVKKALQASSDPLVLVVSGDIYWAVVRHGSTGGDEHPFRPFGSVQVDGHRHPGWVQTPGQPSQHHLINIARYRKPA
jgi:class 3 adenylate cyclase